MLSKLDSLRFSKWHLFVALALGLIWIFDGYEITLISLYRNQIEQESSEQLFKSLVSAYQIGCMVGSLVFGVLAFIVGRKKIFLVI
jgi:MFS family permease